jgi:6-phosphogluconolactonase
MIGRRVLGDERLKMWIEPDELKLAGAAAETFALLAAEAVDLRGRFSVMLSGGNTPRKMFELLVASSVPWAATHVFWSDERLVPPDDPDSNFLAAWEALLSRVPIPPGQIHRVRTELRPAAAVAQDYERQIREFGSRFDLILLGLGEDGHIASLFPEVPIPPGDGPRVLAPWVPKLGAFRISISPEVINSARQVLFLVSGERKARALKNTFEEERDPLRHPAQWVSPREGKTLWIVDERAAALVSAASLVRAA